MHRVAFEREASDCIAGCVDLLLRRDEDADGLSENS
jgi:hypothetical protein